MEIDIYKEFNTETLSRRSPLFWFTLAIPIAIIAIGINFIFNPFGASTAYGVPIHDTAAFPFMWIKGIRDICAGLFILPFLFAGDRRVTSVLFAISVFIPIGDGLVIIANAGMAPAILVHWGTALYMAVVAGFLLHNRRES